MFLLPKPIWSPWAPSGASQAPFLMFTGSQTSPMATQRKLKRGLYMQNSRSTAQCGRYVIQRMFTCGFSQHLLCNTSYFEVFWSASKHPSDATCLNASQSKHLLLSRVVEIAEINISHSNFKSANYECDQRTNNARTQAASTPNFLCQPSSDTPGS